MPRKAREDKPDDRATQKVMELWGMRGDIRDFAKALGFKEHSVRMMIQDQDQNGLAEIITKRGTDILATPERFVEWLEGYSPAGVEESS